MRLPGLEAEAVKGEPVPWLVCTCKVSNRPCPRHSPKCECPCYGCAHFWHCFNRYCPRLAR